MQKQKKQNIGFFVLLAIATIIALSIFWPFWELLAFAIILAILFHPLYVRIESRIKIPSFSAGVVVFIMAIIIAGPVLLIGQQVFLELVDLYKSIHLENFSSQSAFMSHLPASVQHIAATLNLNVYSWASQFLSRLVTSFSTLI